MPEPHPRHLASGFLKSAERFPERLALAVGERRLTYGELCESARRIAATLQASADPDSVQLTAVFAHRSATSFSGVLGALLAGRGYVPINRTFPAHRSRTMFELSECRSIVVDAESLPQLDEVLAGTETQVLVLVPDLEDVSELRERFPRHAVVGATDLAPSRAWQEPHADPDAVAYLLFTSGSTGLPKGVMVAHRNAVAYVDYVADRYEVTENDRHSQMFDLTFDLSVHDMFVTWGRGASLWCPSQKDLINPSSFIKRSELTIWFSVPSAAVFAKRLGALKPDAFPSLRLSLFCGEPLPVSALTAWGEAATSSVLENIYGPTELTIACTYYRWRRDAGQDEAELGIVPIGYPFPGMDVLVADENLKEVQPGDEGELLMTGPQMTLGYWRDPERTAAAFVTPPGRDRVYYRTGDRVRRPLDGRPMTHLGRLDSQVKILGHRVELGEVEAAVRIATDREAVLAVPWPKTVGGYEGIEVFVEGSVPDPEEIRRRVGSELPAYMVPRRIHPIERMPLNSNGKLDRKALLATLEEGM